MSEGVPEKYKTVGTVYLVAGLLNVLGGWWCASAMIGSVGTFCTGVITLGLCPIGGLCGIAGWLLFPLGIAEIAVGAMIMTSEDPSGTTKFAKLLPMIEIPSLLIGGIASAVAGGVVLSMLGDDEVAAYIAVHDD
jgi:hypothetical protein